MDIMLCGITHQEIALREKVNFTDTKKLAFQQYLKENGIQNILILSTCNRSEVLCLGEEEKIRNLPAYYRSFFSLTKQEPTHCYEQEEALIHLYQVCAGLDSVLLGEDQILHQIKEAYAFACHSGCVRKPFHKLIQNMLHFTKKIKDEFRMSEHPLTTSYVAMKKLKQEVSLQGKDILLSGNGEIIQQCLPYLIEEQVKSITMLVRSAKKVEAFTHKYPQIKLGSFEERYLAWQKADIVISATTSPHTLFLKEQIPKDQKERWVYDLALPRDVDERLKSETYIHMYDIDEVQQTLKQHVLKKSQAVKKAQDRIDEEARQQYQKLKETQNEVVIADFQKHLLSMAEDTYHLLEHKLTLQPHEQQILKKTLDYSFLRFLSDWLPVVKSSEPAKQEIWMEWINSIHER